MQFKVALEWIPHDDSCFNFRKTCFAISVLFGLLHLAMLQCGYVHGVGVGRASNALCVMVTFATCSCMFVLCASLASLPIHT